MNLVPRIRVMAITLKAPEYSITNRTRRAFFISGQPLVHDQPVGGAALREARQLDCSPGSGGSEDPGKSTIPINRMRAEGQAHQGRVLNTEKATLVSWVDFPSSSAYRPDCAWRVVHGGGSEPVMMVSCPLRAHRGHAMSVPRGDVLVPTSGGPFSAGRFTVLVDGVPQFSRQPTSDLLLVRPTFPRDGESPR